ncbi:DUF4907 domain-containing protein [Paraflavitalea soli]|nr:DUF4907 domain-containing protein [Paraflavitalea soli]
MTTNKARRIIIAAVVIAVAITCTKWYWYKHHQAQNQLSYQCFSNGQGWGYDILLGKKILIHQSINPAVKGRIAYDSKQAAEADARIVIGKIKLGETPVFNSHQMQHTGTLPAQ